MVSIIACKTNLHRSKGQRSNANSLEILTLCVCKLGFAKLTVDYSEDQRGQRIALSAINNAFGVHSNHVQDIAVVS